MKMKKLFSVLLCLCLVCTSVSFAAEAYLGSVNRVPIILVGGRVRETAFYNSEGEKVYPPENLDTEEIMTAVMHCLPYLASGALTGDFKPWIDEFYGVLAPYFEDVILDPDGYPRDSGLKNEFIYDHENPKRNGTNGCDYTFSYDWRLDPCDIADELDEYIDCILKSTGAEKVSLEGRCFGTNMVLAYLYEYGNEKIDSVVMYVGTMNGHGVVTDLFSGDFELDVNAINRYLESGSLDISSIVSDPVLAALVDSFLKLITTLRSLNIPLDYLSKSIESVYLECAPRIVMATYGTFSSIWSCVANDEYQKAREIVFRGQEQKYAGILKRIDHIQNDILAHEEELLSDLKSKGLKIAFVVKSNMASAIPIGSFAHESGDDSVSVNKATLGATAAPLGTALSDAYLKNADSRYVSSDKMIDASTALFRDTTWIIKDCPHSNFCRSIDDLILRYFNSEKEMTVFDYEEYPQFLKFNSETQEISPLNDEFESQSFFKRFLSRLIDFLRVLFGGIGIK